MTMTKEIQKENWVTFFDDLTKRRFDWQTKIEVFSDDFGSQVLDEGLPLAGITSEGKGDKTTVAIFVGTDEDHHQTHTIKNPTKVAYLGDDIKPSGIVEIEEASGTKTLVHIIQPMPIVTKFTEDPKATAA